MLPFFAADITVMSLLGAKSLVLATPTLEPTLLSVICIECPMVHDDAIADRPRPRAINLIFLILFFRYWFEFGSKLESLYLFTLEKKMFFVKDGRNILTETFG